jgi:hypothetical protein
MAEADHDPYIPHEIVLPAGPPFTTRSFLAWVIKNAAQGLLRFRTREVQTLFSATAVSLVTVQ